MSAATPSTKSLTAQVGALLSGTTAVQALSLLLSPIVARLYSPTALGEIAAATVIAGTVSTVSTLALDSAVVLADSDEEAEDLGALVSTSAFLSGVVVTIGTYLAAGLLMRWATFEFLKTQRAFWSAFVGMSAFVTTFSGSVAALANRRHLFGSIARGRVLQSLCSSALTITLGVLAFGARGAALGALGGQVVMTGVLLHDMPAVLGTLWRKIPSPRQAAALLSKHRRFPLYSYPQTVFDQLRENAIVAGIASAGGPVALGYWAMYSRAVRGPFTVLGQAFTQVFTTRAAASVREGEALVPLTSWVSRRTILLAATACVVLIAAGPWLFAHVFGARWRDAGEMARLLSPWVSLNFVVSPFVQLAFILRRNRTFLFFGVAYDLALIGICSGHLSMSALLPALSVVGTLFIAAMIWWLLSQARRYDEERLLTARPATGVVPEGG